MSAGAAPLSGVIEWSEAPAANDTVAAPVVTRDVHVCPDGLPKRRILVQGRLVEGAVVWADAAAASAGPQPKGPVVLRRQNCRFEPRVLVVSPGTKLAFENQDPVRSSIVLSDPSDHRLAVVHVLGKNRPVALAPLTEPGIHALKILDGPVWMNAHVLVRPQIDFTQTSSQGAFRLEVPPGERTIRVWHPDLGQLETHVSVPEAGRALRLLF